MLEVQVPGWGGLRLERLVLDVNGTLTRDGEVLAGLATRVAALRGVLAVSLLSADTFGRLDAIAAELQVEAQRLLGPEGLAVSALLHADVLVASIDDALDLLLNPKRLLATLRH